MLDTDPDALTEVSFLDRTIFVLVRPIHLFQRSYGELQNNTKTERLCASCLFIHLKELAFHPIWLIGFCTHVEHISQVK